MKKSPNIQKSMIFDKLKKSIFEMSDVCDSDDCVRCLNFRKILNRLIREVKKGN